MTTWEPNILSMCQLGRNIPFAAECPTEQAATRLNLDVIPYYMLIGQQGIGNLLWECGPPCTVVDDKECRRLYGETLYPLRNAQAPIATARGTDRILGWYRIRELDPNAATDAAHNFVDPKAALRQERITVREGKASRIVDSTSFTASLRGLSIEVKDSAAGIITAPKASELVVVVSKGTITIPGLSKARAEEGRFEGSKWVKVRSFPVINDGENVTIKIEQPKVLRLMY
jgi:hypothetical protein